MLLIFSHNSLQPTKKILPQPHAREGEEEGQGNFQGDLPPEVGIVVEKAAGVERKKDHPCGKRKDSCNHAEGQKTGIGSRTAEGGQGDGRHVEKADCTEGDHGGVAEGIQNEGNTIRNFLHTLTSLAVFHNQCSTSSCTLSIW